MPWQRGSWQHLGLENQRQDGPQTVPPELCHGGTRPAGECHSSLHPNGRPAGGSGAVLRRSR
eukprot:12411645-Karenia_brevis.AAC.1